MEGVLPKRSPVAGTKKTQKCYVSSVASKATERERVNRRHGVVFAEVTHTKMPRVGVRTNKMV